jgi:pilus assembly protein CpaC
VGTDAPRNHSIILSKAITDAIEAKSATMDTNFENAAPAEQQIHMIVGRTIFIDTKHRLTRVYVTDPTVLNSYTPSPNQVVLTALKTGTSTLLVWDENGASQAYIVSADLDLDSLSKVMKDAFPAESIDVHASEGRVLLTGYVGTEASYEAAQKMAEQYSKDVSNSLVVNSSRVKQVRLKVRIVELDRTKLAQFGFNFFSAGGNNLGSTTTGAFPSSLIVGSGPSVVGNKFATLSNPLNFSLYSSKLNIGATLQDLASMNIAQILAEPTITTMSGQKANFLAGGEFPFPVVQPGSGTTAASVSILFKTFGVKLEFTPKVNSDGTIDLKVTPEVSALDFSNAVSIAGYTIPAISTRRADTEMVLQNGQSFAISGLLDQRTQDTLARTPGIASIPILGELFKSKNTNHSISELVVIVTPEIVDPMQEKVTPPAVPPALHDNSHPGEVEPGMVVPKIDDKKFDKELPKAELKQ